MSKFCVLPFVHFEVDTDGKIRACCVYDGHYLKDDGTHLMHVLIRFQILEIAHGSKTCKKQCLQVSRCWL